MKINPCKCGSTKEPHYDSDDMVPCWIFTCRDCKQQQHGENGNWSFGNSLSVWNRENPIKQVTNLDN